MTTKRKPTREAKAKASKPPPRKLRASQVTPRALRDAAQFGKRDEVERLLAAGADPNALDGMDTALCMACFHKQVSIVRLLLAAGADPNHTFPGATPALVYALTSKSKRAADMVRMLLDAGAEPNPIAYRDMRLIDYCRGMPHASEAIALLEDAAAKRA